MREINLLEIENTSDSIRTFVAHLESVSPLSFSRHYSELEVPKLNKESPGDYEKRTWKNRLHVNKESECFIPRSMLQKAIISTAAFLSIKKKGQATWTKNFERSLIITDDILLGIHRDDVQGEALFVPSDGKIGGAKRVEKIFPVIPTWNGIARIQCIDDSLPEDIFAQVLIEAGRFNGLGRFRPQLRGFYGRFNVAKLYVEDGSAQ